MKKLMNVRLAHSIRFQGSGQVDYLTSEKFDLALEQGVIVRAREKRTQVEVCTSLFNCISWTEVPSEEKKADAPAGGAAPSRGSRPKKDPQSTT